MKRQLEEIVATVKTAKAGACKVSIPLKKIGNTKQKTVAAIDGGSATLWSNGVHSIGVVRYGFIVYDPSFHIIKTCVESDFFLIEDSGEKLDFERHRKEVGLMEKAASYADVVLFDGALTDIPQTGMKEAIIKASATSAVVGISKKSKLATISQDYPDTWISFPPRSYYKLPDKIIKERFKKSGGALLADTYFACLDKVGPVLRIDIAGKRRDIFEILSHYSNYHLFPGYPFPLAEIHRIVCLDDKKEIYDNLLRKEMKKQGLLKEYL
ncbi:MAG: DNA double-strand break repair nuclease NurA, partial [Candidatus Methanofastidiosia archaeon]